MVPQCRRRRSAPGRVRQRQLDGLEDLLLLLVEPGHVGVGDVRPLGARHERHCPSGVRRQHADHREAGHGQQDVRTRLEELAVDGVEDAHAEAAGVAVCGHDGVALVDGLYDVADSEGTTDRRRPVLVVVLVLNCLHLLGEALDLVKQALLLLLDQRELLVQGHELLEQVREAVDDAGTSPRRRHRTRRRRGNRIAGGARRRTMAAGKMVLLMRPSRTSSSLDEFLLRGVTRWMRFYTMASWYERLRKCTYTGSGTRQREVSPRISPRRHEPDKSTRLNLMSISVERCSRVVPKATWWRQRGCEPDGSSAAHRGSSTLAASR